MRTLAEYPVATLSVGADQPMKGIIATEIQSHRDFGSDVTGPQNNIDYGMVSHAALS